MRNRDDIEISEIGVNAFNSVIGSFNWGNDNRYTAANAIDWGIDCYNSGVELVRNYPDDLRIRDESGELKYLYPIIEARANEFSSLSSSQEILEIFYYLNVPRALNNEYATSFYEEAGIQYNDIYEIMRYGVFLLARDLIELGYERRDDGEA